MEKLNSSRCSSINVVDVVATADPMVGFKDCDSVFMLGAMPRREGMERKDLLKANCKIFEAQGAALDKVAKKTVKVNTILNFVFFLLSYQRCQANITWLF